MKCEVCGKDKKESEVLPGIPTISKVCYRKLNGFPRRMPKAYYQGHRDGKMKGIRLERRRLRLILQKHGPEALIEAILKRI